MEIWFRFLKAPKVVIVGGGWAGFGAAEGLAGLAAQGKVDVTLLEAAPRAGGLAAAWKTPGGRKVEAGIHGFWRNYRNIDRLVEDSLGLTGSNSPFTPFTESTLFTTRGRAVVAPELGDKPRLPAPLGTAVFPSFETLDLPERATAAGLALPWLDFDGGDDAWRRYDDTTAATLLARPPVSRKLYEEFLLPMLLVLPMAPGYDISAAAALSCFDFFALAHQSDFDVRWLKAGATDCIFEPWRAKLEARGVVVRDGKRVEAVEVDEEGGDSSGSSGSGSGKSRGGSRKTVTAVRTADGERIECDALVSGVSISAMQAITRANRESLAPLPEFQRIGKLRAVGVVAVRLWLDGRLAAGTPRTPSNVVGGGLAPELENIGWTFYHLNDLQDELKPPGEHSVVECDFYNAAPLMALSDDELVDLAVRALRRADPVTFSGLQPYRSGSGESEGSGGGGGIAVEDVAVVRVGNAVSHFAPGTYRNFPGIRSESLENLCFAGDWVDRGGHRSWSQEKAYVTGLQAAKATVEALVAAGDRSSSSSSSVGGSTSSSPSSRSSSSSPHLTARDAEEVPVPLDVEDDEPHIKIGRSAVRALRGALPPFLQ